jgi:glycosyltransferase involved in cell wall biosynthesis
LVYSAIGIGTLESLLVGRLGPEQMNSFLTCQSFFGIKDERMKKCLAACDKVVLENETLNSVYKNFYGLSNTVVLQNFRLVPQNPLQKVTAPSDSVQLVYLSRVAEEKGIFDLIQAVKEINQEAGTVHFSLDIYGPIDLDSSTRQIFFGALTPNIVYKGTVKPEKSIETLSRYHLLCFPTKLREGTPGVIAESLIAGTPILSSNFAQAKELIAVGKDGFLFQISSFDSLKDSLKQIYLSRGKLIEMRSEALKMSVQFTYSGNRTIFLSLFSSSSGSNQ